MKPSNNLKEEKTMNNPLLINFTVPKIANYLRYFLIYTLNGRKHWQALLFYFFIVAGHFTEHFVQIGQVYLLGWSTRKAGGHTRTLVSRFGCK